MDTPGKNFEKDGLPGLPVTGVDPTGPLPDELQRLFNLSPALLCIAGTDGYFKRVNPAFFKTLGHAQADLLSRPFIEFVHPDDRQTTLNVVLKLSKGTPAVHFENRYRHADGSYRWLLWSAVPVVDEQLMYATAIDITERKASTELLRGLTQRLVVAEEGERRRIARGLHDDVGQTLLAAKLSLSEVLEGTHPDERDASAQELERLLDRAIQTTRTLTFELASEVLYAVGLGSALQSMCESAEARSGIRFEVSDVVEGKSIPEATRVILYRTGRELIRNVVNHSDARTAKVSLSLSGGLTRLAVEDDGSGFDAATQLQGRKLESCFGLFSVDQQLRPLRGRLEIASSPGSGTRAVVTVPLDTEEG